MINQIAEFISGKNSGTSTIFEPITLDLKDLEEKLAETFSSENKFIEKIAKYIIQAGGKRLRPAVCFLFAKALNRGMLSSNHFDLALALELIHTATLVHDDVIDNAHTRRGLLTIGQKWNDKTAILVGDYLLAKSLIKLSSLRSPIVVEIFANVLSEVCEGEVQQFSQDYKMVSIEQYIEKSKRKTAMLFVAGAESAAIITPNADNLTIKAAREYALNFGIAFQIIDDALNFTSANKEMGKPVESDLSNGILTAPVLFALDEYEKAGDFTLKNLIKNKLKREKDLKLARLLVNSSGGISKTIEMANSYIKKACDSLEIIEDSIYKQALIDLAHYVVTRKS